MKDFKTLKVWEKSHALTLEIYRASASFPKEELYGLTAQIRRASASVPANIAEGCGGGGDAEFMRYLKIAAGSVVELEYHLLLAHDLGYISPQVYNQLNHQINEVKQMLSGLLRTLRLQQHTKKLTAKS